MNVEAAAKRASEFETLWNVIVAPPAAFESIRERRRWLIAWLVVTILVGIATYLMIPTMVHAMTVWYPSQVSTLTQEQQQKALGLSLTLVRLGWIFAPLTVPLASLFTGLILWLTVVIARSVRHQPSDGGDFVRLFALAANVCVIYALSQVVLALIVFARGPASFASPSEVQAALPSLGWLAGGGNPKLTAFLAAFNPFSIWSFFLLAFGTAAVSKVPQRIGYIGAAIVFLLTALFLTVAAR